MLLICLSTWPFACCETPYTKMVSTPSSEHMRKGGKNCRVDVLSLVPGSTSSSHPSSCLSRSISGDDSKRWRHKAKDQVLIRNLSIPPLSALYPLSLSLSLLPLFHLSSPFIPLSFLSYTITSFTWPPFIPFSHI